MKIPVAIVDDHQLFLKSLSMMIDSFANFEVVAGALNGNDLQQKFPIKNLPQIILIDVNMPVLGGIETATWLNKNFPLIKLVALSMNDNDRTVISMIKAGCCAYLLKDIHPDRLEIALNEIHKNGFYNADEGNINYRRILINEKEEELNLTESDKLFLQLCCSEMTYKEIAAKMKLTERNIDWYRETMFKTFSVQNRVGLVLAAIRRDLVKI